ncbi:MAG: acyltransferase family protein [Prolixibacteraceae bacterium]
MSSTLTTSKRLISLDALRGFTIAGMILVNMPGDWGHTYGLLKHAHFNGLTLADLVFPFFLFIVGASIVLALKKRLDAGVQKAGLIKKIVSRTLIIFLLGLLLNWITSDFSPELRIAGVLQRIAICYLVGSLLFIYTSQTVQVIIGLVFLLGYWMLSVFVPVPGQGVVFSFDMSWQVWVDQLLLPGKMYFGTWDPEGLLSTFPAIVNTLLGIQATILIQKLNDQKMKMIGLFIFGISLLVAGLLLSSSFPVNKNAWTSSFVLVTSGLASIFWSVLMFVIDVKGWRKWAKPGIIFGANAITAYVLHEVLIIPIDRIQLGSHSLKGWVMVLFNGFLPPEMASLAWALFFVFLCFLPIWWMYRKKIFVKI